MAKPQSAGLTSDPSVLSRPKSLETVIREGAAATSTSSAIPSAASVALVVAMRKRVPIASLTVLEAPLPSLLRQCGEEAHYRAFRDMTDAYFAAYHSGDREAIATMIDFYGGDGTWASWPERVRAYAVETTPVNMLDWALRLRSPAVAGDAGGYRRAGRRGGRCEQPSRDLPRQWLRRRCRSKARRSQTIGGAAHFMISTHPAQVAELIADTRFASGDAATLSGNFYGSGSAGEGALLSVIVSSKLAYDGDG